ncbi:MAG: aminotransferase class V-fold PLP-dependent enzyme, partial [Flavobacteriales bacterium]
YIEWQQLLEKEPVQFITVDGFKYIDISLKALGAFLNCDSESLVYIPNPTHAINLLVKSLALNPGDEILTTDLEYGAMDRTWNFYCSKSGARYIRQNISLPLTSKEEFLKEFWSGYSEKTKVVFISQITSSTALILPVKEICDEARKRGLITIIDGAHVPGHIPLDITKLDPDYYTGACHKWMMTPKGSSFLYARKSLRDQLEPLIISWGYESINPSGNLYFDYHQFNGTRDFSAYLTIPKAIEFRKKYNWNSVSENCKIQLRKVAPELFNELATAPLAPLTEEFFGQICSVPINTLEPEKLQRLLFETYKIEIPVMRHGKNCYIRFSFQAFNHVNEVHHLIESLKEIKRQTNLII